MKKIVLLLVLTMFSISALGANEGKIDSTLARLKSEYEIETVRIGGSLLRMMMTLSGDRQARKAFKAMNIKEIIMTEFQDEPEKIASKVVDKINKALEADGYIIVPPDKSASEEVKEEVKEKDEIKWDAYTLIEGEMVYGYAILTYFPKASFLCVRCSMKVSELEKLVGMIKNK